MTDEARLLVTVWEAVSDFIASGSKQEAADALVRNLIEAGNELDDLYDADGECPYLDRALAAAEGDVEDLDEMGDYDE